MKISYLGKELRRKPNGQFKKKENLLYPTLALAVVSLMIVGVVYADEIQKEFYSTHEVVVTAEVALDCLSPTHIYTEECVKRLTDDVAISFVDLKKAEKLLQEAQTLYDSAFEAHEVSVEHLNSFRNGI
jgi:hypothetical protein